MKLRKKKKRRNKLNLRTKKENQIRKKRERRKKSVKKYWPISWIQPSSLLVYVIDEIDFTVKIRGHSPIWGQREFTILLVIWHYFTFFFLNHFSNTFSTNIKFQKRIFETFFFSYLFLLLSHLHALLSHSHTEFHRFFFLVTTTMTKNNNKTSQTLRLRFHWLRVCFLTIWLALRLSDTLSISLSLSRLLLDRHFFSRCITWMCIC